MTPLVRQMTIKNRLGLHARAAARFVKTAGSFNADIAVKKDGTEVSGLSIMGLMMLAATPGTTIEVSVRGEQAAEAMQAIEELVADKFGED